MCAATAAWVFKRVLGGAQSFLKKNALALDPACHTCDHNPRAQKQSHEHAGALTSDCLGVVGVGSGDPAMKLTDARIVLS